MSTPRLRPVRLAFIVVVVQTVIALRAVGAQTGTVSGQVVLRETGEPLGFIAISVLSQGTQHLTGESGAFVVRNVPAGQVRLRFKRIGFSPTDTVVTLAANDTARLRIEMTRLAIELPAMLVSGRCANETPFEPRPAFMAQLFDQLQQNAERMKLLAAAKPFVIHTTQVRGTQEPGKPFVPMGIIDNHVRGPLPVVRYEPKRVARPLQGRDRGNWAVHVPELADFADTAFTNNHCFHYAGQTRLESDSVIAIDFEPVPWLAKEVDVVGTMYLRVDGYQLAGVVARINRQPRGYTHIREYVHRTWFRDVVPGVPVLVEWRLENIFVDGRPSIVANGRVVEIRWADSTAVRVP